MKWFDKVERKLGRYAIPNLMRYMVIVSIIGSVIGLVVPGFYEMYLSLNVYAILHGQVWRIVTFLFLTAGTFPHLLLPLFSSASYPCLVPPLTAAFSSPLIAALSRPSNVILSSPFIAVLSCVFYPCSLRQPNLPAVSSPKSSFSPKNIALFRFFPCQLRF